MVISDFCGTIYELKQIDYEDNWRQLFRQLLSIQGNILFGLEECAGRIGNPKQNELRRVTAFFCEMKIGLI